MDNLELASGDNLPIPSCFNDVQMNQVEVNDFDRLKKDQTGPQETTELENKITPQIIENNEHQLKSRIAQCKIVIESLKIELNKEKAKLERELKLKQTNEANYVSKFTPSSQYSGNLSSNDGKLVDSWDTYCTYSTSVDDKLICDENLMEYEKQLEKYQNTLNMAQNEKKNAIRKQMLTKAFKLKLLEIENQCNIELLRVKQSLQCLEPLKIIASKWKTSTDDVNNFEFLPRFPELNSNSESNINFYRDDISKTTSVNIGSVNVEASSE